MRVEPLPLTEPVPAAAPPCRAMKSNKLPSKRAILILLVISLSLPMSAKASDRAAGVAQVEQAFAEWLFPTERPNHFRWLAVSARRESPIAGGGSPTTIAYVTRGTCSSSTSDGEETIICAGSPRKFSLRADQFSMDPVNATARVTIRTPRLVHSVRWSTDDAVVDGAYWEDEDCSGQRAFGAGASQLAYATGRVSGVRVSTNENRDFAALDFGTVISQC